MMLLTLILCSLVFASSTAYKESEGIELKISKTVVVLDFTEDITILCSTSDMISGDGYKVINKIEIDRASEDEFEGGEPAQDDNTQEIEHLIVASIDSHNGTRGASSDGTLTVKGSIKEVTNSFLMMTFSVATNLALGTFSCHVHGYSNDVTAHPVIRTSYNSQSITKTDTDIEAVTQLVVEEKKAIESLEQNLNQLQLESINLGIKFWSLLDTDNLYSEYWPTGNFSLLQPATGCPPNTRAGGWRQPSIKIPTKNWAGNEDKIPKGFPAQPAQDKESAVVLYFCSLVGKGHYAWPPGDYCINKNRPVDKCPAGFEEGAIAFGIASLQVTKDVLKRNPPAAISTFDDDNTLINVSFCCRNDGDVTEGISLPTHVPFYLYQYKSKACQAVNYMNVVADYIHIDTTGQFVDEVAGATPRHRINGVRLWLCRYTPQAHPFEEIWTFLNSVNSDKEKGEGKMMKAAKPRQGTVDDVKSGQGPAEGVKAGQGPAEGVKPGQGPAEGVKAGQGPDGSQGLVQGKKADKPAGPPK